MFLLTILGMLILLAVFVATMELYHQIRLYWREQQSTKLPSRDKSDSSLPSYPIAADELADLKRELQQLRNLGTLSTAAYVSVMKALDKIPLLPPAPQTKPTPQPTLQPQVAPQPTPVPQVNAAASLAPSLASSLASQSSSDDSIVDAILIDDSQTIQQAPTPRIPAGMLPVSIHPLDQPEPVRSKPVVQRTLSEMLQSFLEESNIRWGEILAGLFIVGSSAGLIISLRNTLKEIPYFPAALFLLATLAFHGAGLYSLRKWKLHAISRAILTIAMLLVPLAFGSAIVLSNTSEVSSSLQGPLAIAAVTAGLLGAAWITWSSARELAPRSAVPMLVSILLLCASQLLAHHSGDIPSNSVQWMLLAILPAAGFLIPTLFELVAIRDQQRLAWPAIRRIALIDLTTLFAYLVPIVLLVMQTTLGRDTFASLAPSVVLVASVLFAHGLVLRDRCQSKRLSSVTTTAVAIAIASVFAIGFSAFIAWPHPVKVLCISAEVGLMLLALTWLCRMLSLLPWSGIAIATAATFALHLSQGRWDLTSDPTTKETIEVLMAGRTAAIWLIVSLSYLALSVWLNLRGKQLAAIQWQNTGIAAQVFSILLAIIVHYSAPNVDLASDPTLAGWTAIVGSFCLLLISMQLQRAVLSVVGAIASIIGMTILLDRNEQVISFIHAGANFPATLLANSVALSSLLLASLVFAFSYRKILASAVATTAINTALFASLLTLFTFSTFTDNAIRLAVLAAVPIITGLVFSSQLTWPIFQMAVTASLFFATLRLNNAEESTIEQLFTIKNFSLQTTMLLVGAALWTTLRHFRERFTLLDRLHDTTPTIFEKFTFCASLLFAHLITAIYLIPGIAMEVNFLSVAEFVQTRVTDDLTSTSALALIPAHYGMIAVMLIVAALRGYLLGTHLERLALFLAVMLIPMAYAMQGDTTYSVASTLRWGLAIYVVLCSSVLWFREQLPSSLHKFLGQLARVHNDSDRDQVRWVIFGVGSLPILAITAMAFIQGVTSHPLLGPVQPSYLARMGELCNYGIPLLLLVFTLLVHAVRESRPFFALAGSILLQATANLGLALTLSRTLQVSGVEAIWMFFTWNLLAASGYGLLWRSLEKWIDRKPVGETTDRSIGGPQLLSISRFFVVGMLVAFSMQATLVLWNHPIRGNDETEYFLRIVSWLAISLSLVHVWPKRLADMTQWLSYITAIAAMLLPFVACCVVAKSTNGSAAGFHTLQWGTIILSAVSLALTFVGQRRKENALFAVASTILNSIYVLLLVTYLGSFDPLLPWNPTIATWSVALICLTLFATQRNVPILWVGTLMALYATFIAVTAFDSVGRIPSHPLWHPLYVIESLVAEMLFAMSLSMQIYSQLRHGRDVVNSGAIFMPHRLLLPLLTFVVGSGVTLHALICLANPDGRFYVFDWLVVELFGIMLLSALHVADFWDRRSWKMGTSLTVSGFALTLLVATMIHPVSDAPPLYFFTVLSSYLLVISLLWQQRSGIVAVLSGAKAYQPSIVMQRVQLWLPAVTSITFLGTTAAAMIYVLSDPERSIRIWASMIPLLGAWSFLAYANGRLRDLFQSFALVAFAIAVSFIGLSMINSEPTPTTQLHRYITILGSTTLITLLYALILPKWVITTDGWPESMRKIASVSGILAIGMVLLTLAEEWRLYREVGSAELGLLQVLLVASLLVSLVVGLLSLALSRRRALHDMWREVLVHLSEMVLLLIAAHLYLCRPTWFQGIVAPYWPYAMLVISALWFAIGQWFEKKNNLILARPLMRTSHILPVLCSVSVWFINHQSDTAMVLFVTAILYGFIAQQRKSYLTGLLAASAINGSLWVVWQRLDGFGFAAHPQLWLIPPAISMLIAAHLYRQQLPAATASGIRYFCTILIYVSSTSEMFLRESGTSLWPPVILALVAMAGVVAGIAFRIRPFLYLGSAFSLVSIVGMVWHAARAIEHVWPWWAFGIGLGILILVLFGVIEKRREDVQRLIQRIRKWEG